MDHPIPQRGVCSFHRPPRRQRGTVARRDGETARRRDGETARRRDGETARRRDGEIGSEFAGVVFAKVKPSVLSCPSSSLGTPLSAKLCFARGARGSHASLHAPRGEAELPRHWHSQAGEPAPVWWTWLGRAAWVVSLVWFQSPQVTDSRARCGAACGCRRLRHIRRWPGGPACAWQRCLWKAVRL